MNKRDKDERVRLGVIIIMVIIFSSYAFGYYAGANLSNKTMDSNATYTWNK
jgi:hypothetical protein